MADLKISQLTDGSPIQLADQIPINRGGSNFRVSPGFTIDATDIFALRNSTTTQTLRVYNTESSSLTNYERTALLFSTYSTVNYARLSVESAGTGSANIPLVISPKGTGAFILGPMPDGTTTGGNARGTNSTDLQRSRTAANQVASGSGSFLAGVNSRASGTGAVAIGDAALATGNYAVALGRSATCSGAESFVTGYLASGSALGVTCIGYLSAVSASYAVALGAVHTVDQSYAVGIGNYSRPPVPGAVSIAQGSFSGAGDNQYTTVLFRASTTDATATKVTNQNGSPTALVIPASKTWLVDIYLLARSSGGTSNAGFVRRVMIKRDASNNTALVGSVQTLGTDIGSNSGSPPAGWAISVTANDTDESLDVTVTGAAATNIRWNCVFKIVELIYA